ncbi:NAD(P)-dependent oxidoreductase [Roseibium porphyridii]|uniref:NAD(P)-dependent oxidoreductase n=1 Tax=Roseibium porphyridii TaxID=2866279 RepID=A0ABY8F7K9_9HYPH|nr:MULTISPECIES: NAD(P)-dependent oxidoreductase [Stappiaceae]QFT30584.1 Glycerate dehydrogenase [Labrenzia sp. THAF82]WFE91221.1 NAD(P)-dependent oxidoreductase [Roseibium sp. KMA01]
MSKPTLIMDQHFRQVEELFRPSAFAELKTLCDVHGGVNWQMARDDFLDRLPDAEFVVASKPELDRAEIDAAPNLRAIIEVSGTFQIGLDYEACFARGIEVLSCAPGFRYSVAEMTLGLILSGARSIVDEHERFRRGSERWFHDNIGTDFSLYGQSIGFVGFGSIARECARLLAPFSPRIKAFDPWLKASSTDAEGADFCDLEEVVTTSRCVIVAATPTEENYKLVSRSLIEKMPKGTLVIVISRSHLVDFEALVEAADAGRIRVACDVFPREPVPQRDLLRQSENVIWSPHRAAAVEGGRHPIGDMLVHDVKAILEGVPERQLQPASRETVRKIIRAPLVAG